MFPGRVPIFDLDLDGGQDLLGICPQDRVSPDLVEGGPVVRALQDENWLAQMAGFVGNSGYSYDRGQFRCNHIGRTSYRDFLAARPALYRELTCRPFQFLPKTPEQYRASTSVRTRIPGRLLTTRAASRQRLAPVVAVNRRDITDSTHVTIGIDGPNWLAGPSLHAAVLRSRPCRKRLGSVRVLAHDDTNHGFAADAGGLNCGSSLRAR